MNEPTKRQVEILNASLSLLGSEGLSKVTMRNIALRVGITEPALYRHFANKQAIVTGLLDMLDAALRPNFLQLTQGENLTDALSGFFKGLFHHFEGNAAFASLVFSDEVFHALPEVRGDFQAFLLKNQKKLTAGITHLQTIGCCRKDLDPVQVSKVVMGTLRLTVSSWLMAPKLFDSEKELSSLVDLLTKVLKS